MSGINIADSNMAQRTASRSTAQALAEWVRVFGPIQATETYTGSVTFMKQLTTVAISTITYMANVFPEESYVKEKVAGIDMRILKKNCKDELAQFVSTSLYKAFHAFENKYLQKLALCFYDGDCTVDHLEEFVSFEYSYSGGMSVRVTSEGARAAGRRDEFTLDVNDMRHQVVQLMRSCLIMQQCHGSLPNIRDISMRLYYNDDAPEGYQAPGFEPSSEEMDQLAIATPASNRLGHVTTAFHDLVANCYNRDTVASQQAQPSENSPVMTQNVGDLGSATSSASGTPRVECPCDTGHGRNEEPMLTCVHCGTLQHAACFGRRGGVARHCCTQCSDADASFEPTDDTLVGMTSTKRQIECLLRRACLWLCSRPAVGARALMTTFEVTQEVAAKLLRQLHCHGVIEHLDDNLLASRKINKKGLKSVMEMLFVSESREDALLTRLMAESLSQERADPVGQALHPTERASLKDASAGKIVEPLSQESATDDLTLKEYKEAMLSIPQKDEDLPPLTPFKERKMFKRTPGKRKAGKENAGGILKRAKATRK